MIRVSNADYLARPLRLSPTEATAIIVALRALRNGARRRDPRGRRPGPGQARGGRRRGLARRADRPGRRAGRRRPGPPRARGSGGGRRGRRQVRLTYYVPSRDEESERTVDPPRRRHRRTASPTSTPGATAPRRRGCSASTGSTRPRCSTPPIETPAEAPRDLADGLFATVRGHHAGHAAPRTRRPAGWWSTTRSRRSGPRPDGGSRSTCWSPTSAGCSGCCCAWPRTPGSSRRPDSRRGVPRPPRRTRSGSTQPAA